MTVSDDITDEMLEHVIKSDGLVSTPFYKDICAELLQRRQADRWIPVEERLPDEQIKVLTEFDGVIMIDCIQDGRWFLRNFVNYWKLIEPPEVE